MFVFIYIWYMYACKYIGLFIYGVRYIIIYVIIYTNVYNIYKKKRFIGK